MVHNSRFQEAVQARDEGGSFEVATREHLTSPENAGETPEQIVSQLSKVAASYAVGGLQDEANTLREIVRQYQLRWANVGIRPA
ncbi:hypothetical protein [Microvirga lotononidis]|uniref:Uncharacterized protein n=1 Tax=Microvirga lotononidis TaxID=864069 RepID=I4YSE3_9HYPH|nr:hypothetical protein [Microvirga lotononidis]EIM26885.1 hypothetical protein MicloDRAFT_00034360 [Microvirga lotononidis]WQO31436.1 hypothetical protein U0023_34700 [Microvirga lotononidis]